MKFSLRKKKEEQNILTMFPELKSGYQIKGNQDPEGRVQVYVPRDSWLEKLSIRFLKQPAAICVQLDELGSYVIHLCDGKHSVEEISQSVEENFGEKASPILPRLIKFFEILETNGWITWVEKEHVS